MVTSLLSIVALVGVCPEERSLQYSFSYSRQEGWQIVFRKKPAFVHGLDASPKRLEVDLKKGCWLVVAIEPLDARRRDAMEAAVRVAKSLRMRHGFSVQVGIRPINDYEAILKWCPEYEVRYESPLWVLLGDGRTAGVRAGFIEDSEIQDWIIESMAKARKSKK